MDCTLIFADYPSGFLGSFLSKGLKTNQLEVNTDEKTLRPIARLKEPRDLFALPKDKDHDCSQQQAPRWPIECQVIEERIIHIPYVPTVPEPYNQPTGSELKPRPVGEENGVVVFNYNPISAVNYEETKKMKRDSSDSDISSSESRGSTPECSTPDRRKLQLKNTFSKLFETMHQRSSSNSNDDSDDDGDGDDDTNEGDVFTPSMKSTSNPEPLSHGDEIENIWATFTKGENRDKVESDCFTPRIVAPVRLNTSQLARLEVDNNLPRRSSSSSFSSHIVASDNDDDVDADSDDDEDGPNTLRAVGGMDTEVDKSDASNKLKSKKTQEKCDKNLAPKFKLNLELETIPPRQNRTQELAIRKDCPGDSVQVINNIDEEDIPNSDSLFSQFSRSAFGGSKLLTNCHPCNADEYDGLEFESRFESGNLAKAVQITKTYYELYLRPDLYTSRSKQWFYFRVAKTRKNMTYRFSIVNLVKSDSLYNDGMRPLMYSTTNAKQIREGWKRCGLNICYYRNDDDSNEEDEENCSYTLTFNIEFPHDNDTVYFAHSYPYTYSELQDYLMAIQKDPVKSKFCKLRLLCRSLAGNNVYYLTVTAPTKDEETVKRKKCIIVSARVHPSETPASWMMKGLMDFITGDTTVAKRLRHRFIFKLIPMLNPDGVIVGNTRNSLTGKDLNRQYRTVIRETYPSIWYTKAMIKRLIDESGVAMYCDMHAHSRKHNIFIYGCENKRNPEKHLTEQVFPLMMHKNVADKFSFEGCKFKIQRSKEGTGRIVVWMLGITNSYTIEASFGGTSLGSRKGTHFTTADYEHIGRAFCETLLDYCDENPNKERLRLKIIERLLREGSSADEPLNIPLTDYSSDEGNSSSSSENEGKDPFSFSDLEGPCCSPLKAPPCSPEINTEVRKFKYKRMRKIMQELDRIYFQPFFKKKFAAILKASKRKEARERKRMFKLEKREQRLALLVRAQLAEKQMEARNPTAAKESNKTAKETDAQAIKKAHSLQGAIKKCLRPKIRKKKVAKMKVQEEAMESHEKIRVKFSRNLRLWLAKRKIIICRRRRKRRKSKFRSKSSHGHRKKSDMQRIPLDMPTTDPCSDVHFSTDDELCAGVGKPHGTDHFTTVPRARRILLQSELQRRYIEEIGDGLNSVERMPPELIITSPKKQAIVARPSAPHSGAGDRTARRTSSWHNLHSSGKCIPKLKIQNPYQVNSPIESDKSDLQFRLSLKKKIWTGVQPEAATNNVVDRNRFLLWGAQTLLTQPKKEHTKKDENEVLFIACSKKLLDWQKEESKTGYSMAVSEVRLDREQNAKQEFSHISYMKEVPHNAYSKLDSSEGKFKKEFRRRKNPLTKIAETTQIITRLAKTKTRNTISTQRHLRTSSSIRLLQTMNSSHKPHTTQGSKFKSSGIVATAAVHPTVKKTKQLRAISANNKSQQSEATAIFPVMPVVGKETDDPKVYLPSSTPATTSAARKTKTRVKKKKNLAGASSGGGATGAHRSAGADNRVQT